MLAGVLRNCDVAAWYLVLLFKYPIFETNLLLDLPEDAHLRHVVGNSRRLHLHMLVYKRLMRWARAPRAS